MNQDYETKCGKCGAKVRIMELSMGVPGGKEKEQADCPSCGNLIAEFMTDGTIRASLVSDGASNSE